MESWVGSCSELDLKVCGNAALDLLFRYIPPLLWGKSGHLQTALYGKMGRVKTPTPCGVRKFLPMQDGATATFDLFEPSADHSSGGNAPTHRRFFIDIANYCLRCF